jgi:hypothetical protein
MDDAHGLNVIRASAEGVHPDSISARGVDLLLGIYNYLHLMPLGWRS